MADRVKKKRREWFIKDKGRGTFRLKSGKKIKPNEQFLAYEYDIPEVHRDLIHKLDGSEYTRLTAEEQEQEEEAERETVNQGGYYKKQRENAAGWFDVYDPQGNTVNESAAREDDADKWVESLNAS